MKFNGRAIWRRLSEPVAVPRLVAIGALLGGTYFLVALATDWFSREPSGVFIVERNRQIDPRREILTECSKTISRVVGG